MNIALSFSRTPQNAFDFHSGGMEMPGRRFNSNTYRYGFNGQEKDNEVGEGITMAQFWEYDSRIARRWNLDPKPQISISDYACFGNNPIVNVDPNGDYFFGLIGSTSEQREAASKLQKETGGTIINKHSKNIMVSYNTVTVMQDGTDKGMSVITNHNQYFNQDGSLIHENGEIKNYKASLFEHVKNGLETKKDDYGFVPHAKFFGRMFYNIADDSYKVATGIYYGQDHARDLTGRGTVGNELVLSGISTLYNVLPVKSLLTKDMDKSLNITEFGSKYKETVFLTGSSAERGAKCIMENLKTKGSVKAIGAYGTSNFVRDRSSQSIDEAKKD